MSEAPEKPQETRQENDAPSPQSGAEVPAALSTLIDEKKQALAAVEKPHLLGPILKTAGGILAGLVGTVFTMAAVLRAQIGKHMQNRLPANATAEMERAATHEAMGLMQYERGITGAMARNPEAFAIGGALAGGAAALMWHNAARGGEVKAARRELDLLEETKTSWVARDEARRADVEAGTDCGAARK